MVIFICGPVGVGKTSLAQALSKRLDIGYCDTDQIKKHFIPVPLRGVAVDTLPDAGRKDAYRAIARELARLSAMHRHVVVDDTLHRQEPRRILLDAADTYFGGFVIVRLRADERTVDERLARKRDGHLLTQKNIEGVRALVAAETQDFSEPIVEHDNTAPLERSVERLIDLLHTTAGL